jgi:hypothetical protein
MALPISGVRNVFIVYSKMPVPRITDRIQDELRERQPVPPLIQEPQLGTEDE